MIVEKEVGGNEVNDKSIRPGLSEMTSNTTLSVPQVTVLNTITQPVVEHHAGTWVFFLRYCICDQINHINSFVYGQDRREVTQKERQRKREKAGFLPMHNLPKNKWWTQVCLCSTVEVSMRSDAGINDQHLPQHVLTAGAIMTVPGQDVRKSSR